MLLHWNGMRHNITSKAGLCSVESSTGYCYSQPKKGGTRSILSTRLPPTGKPGYCAAPKFTMRSVFKSRNFALFAITVRANIFYLALGRSKCSDPLKKYLIITESKTKAKLLTWLSSWVCPNPGLSISFLCCFLGRPEAPWTRREEDVHAGL